MKKILFLIAATSLAMGANAQFVLGLQGGYHAEKNSNNINGDYTAASTWLAGGQLGYLVTPKLYLGVSGAFTSENSKRFKEYSTVTYNLTPINVTDSTLTIDRTGWTVSPMVRYELLAYGNMHFNLLLSGTISQRGYQNIKNSYIVGPGTTVLRPGEYMEVPDPYYDSISTFTWGVSLRPTLTYEFSEHLNAELTLDLLSIGYISQTTTDDATLRATTDTDGNTVQPAKTTTTLYAGLNSLRELLSWESPMLRLGFNYVF